MSHKSISLALTSIVFLVMTVAITPIGNAVVWTNETRLTTHLAWDAYPSIAQMQDDRIWFVWQSDRGGNWTFDIYYTIYDWWFGTWSPQFPLTTDPSHDIHPSLMPVSYTHLTLPTKA